MSVPVTADSVRAGMAALQRMRQKHRELERDQQRFVHASLLVLVQQDFPEVEDLSYSSWGCPVDKHEERKPRNHADDLLDKDKPNALGFCVYDNERDPCNDCCLYCGKPRERK